MSSRLFGIGDDRDDERSDEAYEVDDDEDVPDPARRVEVDAEQLGHERAQKGKDGQCEAGAAAPCPPAVRRCRRYAGCWFGYWDVFAMVIAPWM